MKIFWDPRTLFDSTPSRRPGQVGKSFENYLREALSEEKTPQVEQAFHLVEEVLPLLERFAEDPASRAKAGRSSGRPGPETGILDRGASRRAGKGGLFRSGPLFRGGGRKTPERILHLVKAFSYYWTTFNPRFCL